MTSRARTNMKYGHIARNRMAVKQISAIMGKGLVAQTDLLPGMFFEYASTYTHAPKKLGGEADIKKWIAAHHGDGRYVIEWGNKHFVDARNARGHIALGGRINEPSEGDIGNVLF